MSSKGTATSGLPYPEGMPIAEFRKHPVYRVIRGAAYMGAFPSAAELDALELSESARRQVAAACERAREPRSTGNFADAWRQADYDAAEIVSDLPESQRDPHYLDPPPEPDPTDPRELAARVSRRF